MPYHCNLSEKIQIISLHEHGRTIAEIAEETGRHFVTVAKWVRIFEAWGEDGLQQRPKPGRPLKTSGAQDAAMADVASRYPFMPLRDVAVAAGVDDIHVSSVSARLKKAGMETLVSGHNGPRFSYMRASGVLRNARSASPAYILPDDPPDLKPDLEALKVKYEPQDTMASCSQTTTDDPPDLKPDLEVFEVKDEPQDTLTCSTTTDDPASSTPDVTTYMIIKDEAVEAATTSSPAHGVSKLCFERCSDNCFGQDCESLHAKGRQSTIAMLGSHDFEHGHPTTHRGNILISHQYADTGVKRHRCDDCGKMFTHLGRLSLHRKKHLNEKPCRCEECGKTFAQQNSLVRHRLIHTGEKPYTCDFCGKMFHHKSSSVAHRRLHTGDRPYKCDVCGKMFNDHGSMICHRRVHTGDKPYRCDRCGKRFTKKCSLTRHLRIHTREKPSK